MQRESCESSTTWGKMRTAARERAPQIALGDCSKEVGEKHRINVILIKGVYVQSSTFVELLLVTRKSHHHEGF